MESFIRRFNKYAQDYLTMRQVGAIKLDRAQAENREPMDAVMVCFQKQMRIYKVGCTNYPPCSSKRNSGYFVEDPNQIFLRHR